MKKLVSIGFLGLLLVAAGCSKTAVNNNTVNNQNSNTSQQINNPYADWKQYENTKFNYKVKYPPSVPPHDSDQALNSSQLSVVQFSDWTNSDSERAKSDQVLIYANSRYAPVGIAELKNEEVKDLTGQTGRAPDEVSVITIGGEQAIKSVYKPTTATPDTKTPHGTTITFYHNNVRYMITVGYNPEMVEGFVKTFEFTK